MGTLLYTMTSRLKDPKRLGFLTDSIARSKIITEQQLTGTIGQLDTVAACHGNISELDIFNVLHLQYVVRILVVHMIARHHHYLLLRGAFGDLLVRGVFRNVKKKKKSSPKLHFGELFGELSHPFRILKIPTPIAPISF